MKRLLIAGAAVLALAGCATEPQRPVATSSAASAPSAAAVSDTQSRLAALGLYSGPIDGVWGAETRDAVARYQSRRGLAVDGILGDNTIAALRNETASMAPRVAGAPSSTAVSDAQSRLAALGLYSGPIDGVWGAETRDAVARYQSRRGLAADGVLGDSTLASLRGETGPGPRVAAAPPPPPPRAVPINDPTTVRTVQNRLKQLGYYDGPADGVWGPGTQVALERFESAKGLRSSGQLTTATLGAMGLDAREFPANGATASLDPNVVRAVQTRLRRDGYYRGGVDGTWGPGTQSGVERFQRARGLEATGQLTPATVSALGLDPNNLAQSAASSLGSGSSRRY